MAHVRLHDGSQQQCSTQTGIRLWQILNGQVEPNAKERRIADRVKAVYIGWQYAPDDYITARFDIIAPMVIRQWMVKAVASDTPGKKLLVEPVQYTRPDPSNLPNIAFSTKWGLLDSAGNASNLAKRYV